jgi:hypothetical protein
VTATEIAAGELVRPFWRRLWPWLVLAAVIAIGAVLVGSLSESPTAPLDPNSAHQDGSKALVRVLAGYGTTVSATSSLADALRADAVVVTAPDAYSDSQLRRLASSSTLVVFVRPGVRASRAVVPGLSPDPSSRLFGDPICTVPAAQAAGRLDLPADAVSYTGNVTSCYGGLMVERGAVVVLGSVQLLENDTLDQDGVAALDVNLISADRTVPAVTWLLPGADAGGSGPASIWDLFPGGVYRAAVWLVLVGVVLAVWRARRLGGVVTEPLPVIVRAAEVVEGHGRLYARAGARDRAAATLRSATRIRVAARLALPRTATAEQVAVAAASLAGRSPADVAALLGGPPPQDDAALSSLASELDRFESAVGTGLDEGNEHRG